MGTVGASPTPTFTPTATFTPTPTPTATHTATVALKETNVTNHSFTANWKSVSGATGYRLDVATDPPFANYVPGYHDLDVGNVTSQIVTPMDPDSLYYYRVPAYNGSGTSANSKFQ